MSSLQATNALRSLPRKVRVLIAIAAITVAAWPATAIYAGTQDKSVIGKWKLTAVLDSSEITAIDDDQAQKLVGQVLSIETDKVRFGRRVCRNPDFEVTSEETNDYFERRAHVSARKLGLPNPVSAVHIDCTYVYKKAADKLVVHWRGYFFDAVRLGAFDPKRPGTQ